MFFAVLLNAVTHRRTSLVLMLLLLPAAARAHVGTNGVFIAGNAGPYPVYVTVNPPAVIPGEAQVSVVTADARVTGAAAQANVLQAAAAVQMPAAQALAASAGTGAAREFHGTSWLMAAGSWQVRVTVHGAAGDGVLAVPVEAAPARVLSMSRPFAALLAVLGLVLVAAVLSIAAAAWREAQTPPGSEPMPQDRRRGKRAAWVAFAVVLLALGGVAKLWREELARYTRTVYRPLAMQATVAGDTLSLALSPPSGLEEAFSTRRLDDLVLDHDHLMHLYAVRWPAMDAVFHLHPTQAAAGRFTLPLPAMPPGTYRLFADVVHADGYPETATAEVRLDHATGRALAGDDAAGALPPHIEGMVYTLPDGYRYTFQALGPDGAAAALEANRPVLLRFTLLDPAGRAPADMRAYMGMAGHVAVLKRDGTVFAHIHPNGSAAMAAYMLANPSAMSGMESSAAPPSNVAEFPFGFPSAGSYRLVVQMRHGDTVETGAVDVDVR